QNPQLLAQHALLDHFREAAATCHLGVVQAALHIAPAQPLKLRYERLFNVFDFPPHHRPLCGNWMQLTPIPSFFRLFPFLLRAPSVRRSPAPAFQLQPTTASADTSTSPRVLARLSRSWGSMGTHSGCPSCRIRRRRYTPPEVATTDRALGTAIRATDTPSTSK